MSSDLPFAGGLPARVLTMLCLCAGLGGCEYIATRQRAAAIRTAQAPLPAMLATLSLATPRTGERGELEPATELLVTEHGIWVDNTALVARWWRGELGRSPELFEQLPIEAWLRPLQQAVRLERGMIPEQALRDGAAGFLVTPLFDLLSEHVEQEKHYGSYVHDHRFEGRVNIYFTAEVPFATVARVIYTAANAEYSHFVFALGRPGDYATVELRPPLAGCPPPPAQQPEQRCVEPHVQVLASGLLVIAEAGFAGGGRRLLSLSHLRDNPALKGALLEAFGEPEAPSDVVGTASPTTTHQPGPAPPAWASKVLVRAGQRCPSLRRQGARLDWAAFTALIAQLHQLAPTCARAVVGAEDAIPWREVATVMEALQRQAGFSELQLSPALGEGGETDTCAQRFLLPAAAL